MVKKLPKRSFIGVNIQIKLWLDQQKKKTDLRNVSDLLKWLNKNVSLWNNANSMINFGLQRHQKGILMTQSNQIKQLDHQKTWTQGKFQ